MFNHMNFSSAAYPHYQIDDFKDLPLTVLDHFEWSSCEGFEGFHQPTRKIPQIFMFFSHSIYFKNKTELMRILIKTHHQ